MIRRQQHSNGFDRPINGTDNRLDQSRRVREEEEQEVRPMVTNPNVICIEVILKHPEVANEKIEL